MSANQAPVSEQNENAESSANTAQVSAGVQITVVNDVVVPTSVAVVTENNAADTMAFNAANNMYRFVKRHLGLFYYNPAQKLDTRHVIRLVIQYFIL